MEAIALEISWKTAVTAVIVIGVARLAEHARPQLAAVLIGLPVSIGPAFALLAYSQSDEFVARSALYSFASVAAVMAFLIGYVNAARRLGLWGCLGIAYAAWLAAVIGLGSLTLTRASALGIALAGFAAGRLLIPRFAAAGPGAPRAAAPWRFLLVRGVLGGLVVATVVTSANLLGPGFSGLLAGFPVVLASAAWMLASLADNRFAAATLALADRGMVSYAGFCLTVHLLSGPLPALAAIATGLGASIALSLVVLALLRPG